MGEDGAVRVAAVVDVNEERGEDEECQNSEENGRLLPVAVAVDHGGGRQEGQRGKYGGDGGEVFPQDGGDRVERVLLIALETVLFSHLFHFARALRIVGGERVEVEVVERFAEVAEGFVDVGHFEEHGRRPLTLLMQGEVAVECLRVLAGGEERIRLRQGGGRLVRCRRGRGGGRLSPRGQGEHSQNQENGGPLLHIFLILLPLRAQLRKTTFLCQKEMRGRRKLIGFRSSVGRAIHF